MSAIAGVGVSPSLLKPPSETPDPLDFLYKSELLLPYVISMLLDRKVHTETPVARVSIEEPKAKKTPPESKK